MSVFTLFMTRLRGWLASNPFFGQADLFLAEQKQAQPILSASQQRERLKHQRIQALRDRAEQSAHRERPHKLWDKF